MLSFRFFSFSSFYLNLAIVSTVLGIQKDFFPAFAKHQTKFTGYCVLAVFFFHQQADDLRSKINGSK